MKAQIFIFLKIMGIALATLGAGASFWGMNLTASTCLDLGSANSIALRFAQVLSLDFAIISVVDTALWAFLTQFRVIHRNLGFSATILMGIFSLLNVWLVFRCYQPIDS